MAKKAPQFLHTRTVALAGHRSSGKTSVAEAALFLGGAVRSMGSVQDRTSLLDADDESRRHVATMQNHIAWMPWQDHIVQWVDTPGSLELEDVRDAALSAVDAVVLVVDAVSGVELGTQRVLSRCRALELPVLVVVNKADRAHDPDALLADLDACVEGAVVPLTLPVRGRAPGEPELVGVVDIVRQRFWRYLDDASGQHSVEPVPQGSDVLAYRDRLTEAVALTDDALLDQYLEYLELPEAELVKGLSKAVQWGGITPVVFTSAVECVGVHLFLDTLVQAMPAALSCRVPLQRADGTELDAHVEGPFAAQVVSKGLDANGAVYTVCRVRSGTAKRKGGWRVAGETAPRRVNKLYHLRGSRRGLLHEPGPGAIFATWELPDVPVGATLSGQGDLAFGEPSAPSRREAALLKPAGPSDERRLHAAAQVVCQVDSWIRMSADPLTGAAVLRGPSRLALTLACERLARLEVQVQLADVPIGYREVPSGVIRGVVGEHRRVDSDDDVVEFGQVVADVVPTHPDTPLRLVFDCSHDDVPSRYHSAIERGLRSAMTAGPRAGYPLTGVQIVVTAGAYNAIFTVEEHMEWAAERMLRTALERARTDLVEPWLRTEVAVPAACVGSSLAAIGAHHGRVTGVDAGSQTSVITALVPERQRKRLAAKLSSATGGMVEMTAVPDHYESLPASDAARIAAKSPVTRSRTVSPPQRHGDASCAALGVRG